MDLILKDGLPHQQKAVDVITQIFDEVEISKPQFSYVNPSINISNEMIKENIKRVQKEVHPSMRGCSDIDRYLNLDIKMETGTGKTYVYTHTIFELHKKYGFNKFIIVVPSLPIKAGAEKFIKSPYVKRHFRDSCKYNCEIELHALESKKKKKGKNYFPSAVREFVVGSNQVSNKIHVLITNMHHLKDSKGGMLVRDDYDSSVEGCYIPIGAIKETKPIVIMDEPHRFTKGKKTFEFIKNRICPQVMIRFGATYPDKEIKIGRKKQLVKDYNNLIYNLSSCDAFNQNLIKGISKEHIEPTSKVYDKVKIVSVNNKTSVNMQYFNEGKKTKTYTMKKGENLSIITKSFEGIHITGIGSNFIELSNGQIKYQGEEFNTDIYSTSYQEQMLRLSLERHFETERMNFNRKNKIKTLALFFIDDIYSYRKDSTSDKETYLKDKFEELLKERIDIELSRITDSDEPEYKEYLLESKNDISATHAGYFSLDNSDTDEAIAQEVKEILFEKEKLVSIKNEDGSFNTRRFLFSKWTLKEGWDNPNIFTIAKLRSSGSENSKLQEVGRGLRLPVDEFGNRISNEEFFLNYIVDFTEKDFAEELVRQINSDIPEVLSITAESIEKVAKSLNVDSNKLFAELLLGNFIDINREINMEKKEEFMDKYPSFIGGLEHGKVKDNNKSKPRSVKIRKDNYNELKDLWEKLNERYFIYYENIDEEYIKNQLVELLNKDVFKDIVMTSKREIVHTTLDESVIDESVGVSYVIEKPMPYNKFLIRVGEATNLPIKLIHESICEYSKNVVIENKYFNEYSASNLIRNFNDWKIENLQGRFNYKKSNLSIHPTALTNKKGIPKESISQGRIGTKIIPGEPMEKYLYDVMAYDSPLEKDNIQSKIDEVVVFGKIPRNSIRIPTINGGTYSPDFMYVVKNKDGSKELNIVVETKDVESTKDLRFIEVDKIKYAEVFFNKLKLDGYNVNFKTQIRGKKIKSIIDDVLEI